MGNPVVSTAPLQCSFGTAPSTLNVLPVNKTMAESKPLANIGDNKPFVNIPPFVQCLSLANPATASLTAAALGVLTPGPCTPVIPAPWIPTAPTTMTGNMPILTDGSMCNCVFGGIIKINFAGTVKTTA